MRFIALTADSLRYEGDPVYANVDTITVVRPEGQPGESGRGACIGFTSGFAINVKEDADTVYRLIREATTNP